MAAEPVPEQTVEVLEEALGLAERELRTWRARFSRVKGEADLRLRESPRFAEAKQVLEHWREVCMPRAREPLASDRLEKVIARLSKFTADELMLAADGYAKRPYVTNKGRRSSRGKPTQRYVDPTLIYRDEQHVQTGLLLVGADVEDEEPDVDTVDWRKVRFGNHRAILKALREKQDTRGLYDDLGRCHYFECPHCTETLTVFDPEDAVESLLRCRCGMDERSFFRMLEP